MIDSVGSLPAGESILRDMGALIMSIFILGYAAIALEQPLKVNKAATALLTGVIYWTVFILFSLDRDFVSAALTRHLRAVSGISFPARRDDVIFGSFPAYCAGTSGSILIIGTAAGVAVMGVEKINFFWYLKRIG